MSRITVLLFLLLFLTPLTAAKSPNIVYIISDDQAWTDFGFMGNRRVHTPNLDALAEKSARFVNGYVPSSVCRPSLATLLTGLYPHQHGIHFNHGPPGNAGYNRMTSCEQYERIRRREFALIRKVETLPGILRRERGYRSLQTGKFWEGHWRNGGFTEGMTTFEPPPIGQDFGGVRKLASGQRVAHGNGDAGLQIGRRTMKPIYDFIDDCHASETPWMVWYAPYLPHQPHDSPKRFYDLARSRPDVAEHELPYFASIAQFDDTVGKLVKYVEKLGLTDETIFVFVSDNGWRPSRNRQRNRPQEFTHTKRSKRAPFDDGLRTPILFRWDGVIKPATHEGLASSIDIMPTLLSATAATSRSTRKLPGLNLLPAARGDSEIDAGRAVFGEIYPGNASSLNHPEHDIAYRWVRQGNLKLIVPHLHRPDNKSWGGYLDSEEFFDVAADPFETNNLVKSPTQRKNVDRLRRLLDNWWTPAVGKKGSPHEVKPIITHDPLREDALLYRKLAIPHEFLITKKGHTFGGDIRIGDLNGDGRCDFLVYRCNHGAPKGAHVGGMKPTFLGAFDLDGQPLWQVGEGGNQPSRPMSVAVKDWTGDGADDVICFWHKPGRLGLRPDSGGDGRDGVPTYVTPDWQSLADVVVQLRDGRSGKVLREAAPKAITERRRKDPVGANWVHQRLLIANFRGTAEPRDIAVKLGDTYVALDEHFNVLWTYRTEWVKYSQCPAYIPAVGDIDGDDRDELLTGYHLIDDDGSLMWKRKLGANMDSVTIDRWQGQMRAICSGLGHVMTAEGDAVLSLGEKQVPHGQEVRIADFHPGHAGNEMVLRAFGHKPTVHLVSSESNKIINTLDLQFSPTNVGMDAVYWKGPDKPALLFNGGWLWDMQQGKGWQLPELPPPNGGKVHRMGFYHVIPANLCGDAREELVVWDPTATHIYIYTPKSLNETPAPRYRHGPRQYNPRLMD